MTSNEHAKTLGLLFYIFVGIQLFSLVFGGVIVVVMFGAMAAQVSSMPHRGNDLPPAEFFGVMSVFIFIAFALGLLMLIPKALAAYGLRNGKSWARTLTIVASILALFGFPLGTALGVYGLWFVFGDEGKRYFGGDGLPMPPPPPPQSWRE